MHCDIEFKSKDTSYTKKAIIIPRILFFVTNIHNYIIDSNLFYTLSCRIAMYIYYIILHAHFQEWNENKKEDYDTPVLHIKLVFFVELIQVIHLDVKLKSVFQNIIIYRNNMKWHNNIKYDDPLL